MKKPDPFFMALCEKHGIPKPHAEYRFHPARKWRFDWAWPDKMVALEVEGGAYTDGRHTRGSGFVKDMEKYNAAAVLGWTIVRCLPKNLYAKQVMDMIASLVR